ncbi:hypothetical protein Tco_1342328 [Tanacetum coccineum]
MASEKPQDSPSPPPNPNPNHNPNSTATVPIPNGNPNAPPTGVPTGLAPSNANYRLRLNPNQDHRADNYEDLGMEFTPLLFSSLERYLPPNLLNVSRDVKYKYMRDILRRYSTDGEHCGFRVDDDGLMEGRLNLGDV